MIKIRLYKYAGEPNTINKVLGLPFLVEGVFYNVMDVLNPQIRLRGILPDGYNYCYIEELDRFYFIDSTVIEDHDITIVNLKIDVLKTYESAILLSTATTVESSNSDPYISVRNNVFDVRPNFEKIDFAEDLFTEDGEIIMITIKGQNNG